LINLLFSSQYSTASTSASGFASSQSGVFPTSTAALARERPAESSPPQSPAAGKTTATEVCAVPGAKPARALPSPPEARSSQSFRLHFLDFCFFFVSLSRFSPPWASLWPASSTLSERTGRSPLSPLYRTTAARMVSHLERHPISVMFS